MKIAISGASGFIGTHLSAHLKDYGHEIVPLGRAYFTAEGNPDRLAAVLTGCQAVVNLAGAPIRHRWSRSYRKLLYDSRIGTVRHLTEAIGRMSEPPGVFVSVSAVGYYPDTGCHDEYNGVQGNSFLSELCGAWEQAARQVPEAVRVVTPRLGVVLSRQGGAFPAMARPFRMGVAARIGRGTQALSWIALEDLLRALDFVLVNAEMAGPVNFTTPERIDNAGFTRQMKSRYRDFISLPVPGWVFGLLYGKGAQVVVSGQCAVPRKLTEAGYEFRYPALSDFLGTT